jgi:hypothetical protein
MHEWQGWHDEAEHGAYVPSDEPPEQDAPALMYLDLTSGRVWERATLDAPWHPFPAIEDSPIFDALVDEWPDHLQRLRVARQREAWVGVGRGFRQMAEQMQAMAHGLREGMGDDRA